MLPEVAVLEYDSGGEREVMTLRPDRDFWIYLFAGQIYARIESDDVVSAAKEAASQAKALLRELES